MKRFRATDHRALVLASVATHPTPPSSGQVVRDCVQTFAEPLIRSMLSQLKREGLIAGTYEALEITPEGWEWLRQGLFDRQPPKAHMRPGARRRKEVRS